MVIAGRFDELGEPAALVDGETLFETAAFIEGVASGVIFVGNVEEGEHFRGDWVVSFRVEIWNCGEGIFGRGCEGLGKGGEEEGGENCA